MQGLCGEGQSVAAARSGGGAAVMAAAQPLSGPGQQQHYPADHPTVRAGLREGRAGVHTGDGHAYAGEFVCIRPACVVPKVFDSVAGVILKDNQ